MAAKFCVSNQSSASFKASLQEWNLKTVRSLLGDGGRDLTALLLDQEWCKAHSNNALQLLGSFCLHPLPACSVRGYQPEALCTAFACNVRQARELFPRHRDQKHLDFVPVVLPGVTKKAANVLIQYPVQFLLPCPCFVGVRLSLTEPGDTISREESCSVVPNQGSTLVIMNFFPLKAKVSLDSWSALVWLYMVPWLLSLW